jgi:hypothetical protein
MEINEAYVTDHHIVRYYFLRDYKPLCRYNTEYMNILFNLGWFKFFNGTTQYTILRGSGKPEVT